MPLPPWASSSIEQKDAAGRRALLPALLLGGSPVWRVGRELRRRGARMAASATPGLDGKVTADEYAPTYFAVTDANGQQTEEFFDAREQRAAVEETRGSTTWSGSDCVGRLA